MSIQEIANFLVEWEYNEDSYLDITYAALSLFKQDKDCLYAYANSYSPFITHLLEVYEKRQEYSPDKYLIHAGNATVDCGLGYSKDYGIIKEELTVPTSVTEAISSIQQCLELIRLRVLSTSSTQRKYLMDSLSIMWTVMCRNYWIVLKILLYVLLMPQRYTIFRKTRK